jgi:AraC-like DNA-binding protein
MDKKSPEIKHYISDTYFDTDLPAKVIFHKQYLNIWHDHNFYELVLVVSGKGFHKTLERKTPIQNGSLLLLKPGDIHSYQVDNEKLSIINILIQPSFFEDGLLTNLLKDINGTVCIAHMMSGTQNYKRLLEVLQLLKNEESSNNNFRREMFSSLLCEILCISARGFMSSTQDSKHRKYADLIADYMQKHPDQEPRLEDISELTGLTPSYIGRNFKNITGYKFVELVNEYRIKKACDLLVDSNADINEIFHKSGYKSKVYFHRAFKRIIGFSPLQYRKQITDSKSKVINSE